MRKFLAIILVLCTLLCMFSFASADKVKLAYTGGSLNLRTGPGTSYGVNGYAFDGDSVTVLEKGSVWSKVKMSDGRVGYIKNLYISGNGSSYADGTTYFDKKYTAKVKTVYSTSTVNLRAGASTKASSITKLKSGTKVTVLGKNGSWYLVSTSDGTQGFISSDYVSGSSSSSSSTVKATVTGSNVYMREGAGTKYKSVTTLKKGTVIKVLDTSDSKWWKVQYSSYTGYMYSAYLKVNK